MRLVANLLCRRRFKAQAKIKRLFGSKNNIQGGPMSIVDKFRNLPTPLLLLHILSKAIIAFGLGVLLASYFKTYAVWIITGGIVLSIPPIYLILKK
ncbi:MAG: hypothetical protein HQ579_00805 [Candidatus Omnitrophica bacterium]|nr:hypothetical protein [Candidatus Omnitrophota bacterium]